MGSLLQRGLCEDRVFQIFREVATLSCPCDELRWMCHDVLENDCTSYCKIIYPADNCSNDDEHNKLQYTEKSLGFTMNLPMEYISFGSIFLMFILVMIASYILQRMIK